MDPSIHRMSAAELTENAKKLYSLVEMGVNCNAAAFKTLHLPTQKKMGYSLENIMQTQFTVAFTFVVQFSLAVVMYQDFS